MTLYVCAKGVRVQEARESSEMAITDWPENERPREKLLEKGAAALSDAELLAIFLRVGMPGKSAVDLARELLQHYGSITRLFAASARDFSARPGMGKAKYAQLQAVMELARRALGESVQQGTCLDSPQAVADWLRLNLGARQQEVFCMLLLDIRHRLLRMEEVSRGTLGETCVWPREVVKLALAHNAAAVIFAHNHPSGDSSASEADRQLTRALQQALALVDIKVLDHLIITANQPPLSFAQQGWI